MQSTIAKLVRFLKCCCPSVHASSLFLIILLLFFLIRVLKYKGKGSLQQPGKAAEDAKGIFLQHGNADPVNSAFKLEPVKKTSKTSTNLSVITKQLMDCLSLVLQVLYKIAWSESVGRDCSAYCAKK